MGSWPPAHPQRLVTRMAAVTDGVKHRDRRVTVCGLRYAGPSGSAMWEVARPGGQGADSGRGVPAWSAHATWVTPQAALGGT
jgi:hypothetical protein